MMNLFESRAKEPSGFLFREGFLSQGDADSLLLRINGLEWELDLARRVQHYGWRYDYRSRAIDPRAHLGELPEPFLSLAARIHAEGLMSDVPDQVIVNEYLPGQGIAAHVDCVPCFGPEITTISLGDEYPLVFTHVATLESREVWLPVGSLCVLSGEARYDWTHAIAKRKSDAIPGGGKRLRRRRVSVTFRKVVGVL